jgi:SAM-dependent methyltransferase
MSSLARRGQTPLFRGSTRGAVIMDFGFSDATVKSFIEHCYTGEKKTFHVTRLYMYSALRDRFADKDGPDKRCLAISHSANLSALLGLKTCPTTEANYPEHDIMTLSLESAAYDFCVSDQVFEHIHGNPFVAFANTTRILKKGGLVCHTTCFTNPIHKIPHDMWRFSPDGLRLMAEESGCRVIDAAGWGNKEFWALDRLGFRMQPIPDDPQNPIYKIAMKNDPLWPIATWVIAEKL